MIKTFCICTCRWKYKYRLVSSSSGCKLLMSAIASCICPFRIISRIFILSSKESRSTLGSIPDSMRNFSAASLNPSINRRETDTRTNMKSYEPSNWSYKSSIRRSESLVTHMPHLSPSNSLWADSCPPSVCEHCLICPSTLLLWCPLAFQHNSSLGFWNV